MTDKHNVLVLDDDNSIRWVLDRALRSAGYQTHLCADVPNARNALKKKQFDLVLSDIRMPTGDGVSFLKEIKSEHPELPVVLITAHADLSSAVQSFDHGAFEFVAKPFDVDDLMQIVNRALESQQFDKAPPIESSQGQLIGRSPAMQTVFRAIGRLAKSKFTVLLIGESGTGKERVARALHEHSTRADEPFVAINMAAIPQELIEAELFGYEKGAFTGAAARTTGRFEQADGGTLFLDEIGDMPLTAQTRLLRVLSDGGYYRVGGKELLKADVRVIAATHQNLQTLVQSGKFREDLYHRLNVVRIELPAMRERIEDLELLADQFLSQAAQEAGVNRKRFSEPVLKYLQQLDWPGNVRQLENACRYLTVMAPTDVIQLTDLPEDLSSAQSLETEKPGADWRTLLQAEVRRAALKNDAEKVQALAAESEKLLVDTILDVVDGHRQETARLLGWGRNTLTRYLKKVDDE
ncbi:nitrogen regulation protein NR(I) [Permianibacter aggregans]|uniref:DNA-binding transcriptional regulator NtrC n=1 Tax=Permianibacter aggregans TaxID=1510150 RepID=A0A4R6V0L2_9GAMM|nr:nitrogen regulation protein NR(I) [Permianibacter aggregans]QGX40341.1 nitrogen regulation protein NR(I) [Permianibacter aggregans]TDQ49534.1 two-component system nitrogen regulation response regulator GlnG [Permianibacter aggregans]